MKKNTLLFVGILVFVLAVLPVVAQNTVSSKTDFFTGMQIIEVLNGGTPFWIFSGSAKIQLDSSVKDTVKASIAAKYSVSNVFTGRTSPVQTIDLERAFIKVRLSWFNEKYSRLSVGKMPLSWGYGMYFNAGDIIFGADPSALVSFDTNDFRIETAWMAAFQMPFTEQFFAEFVVVPPLNFIPSTGILNLTGAVNRTGGFGGRLVFEPHLYALQSFEAGYLAVDNVRKHRVYAAFDGSIGADYNLCASLEIENGKTFSEYGKTLALSAAFFYTFTISGDTRNYPLTLRGEALYYPVAEKISSFGMVSFGFTDSLSASVMYLNSIAEKLYTQAPMEHALAASLVWTPIKRLQLVVQGSLVPSDPKKMSSVTAGCVYAF